MKSLKSLTFINLGTRGSGISSIGELYKINDRAAGRVGTMRLLFRDERGMRLACELGKHPPRGAEVVFGTMAYRMWKNGTEWNMRTIVSINGMAVKENVFIAEHFVEKQSASKKVLQVRNTGNMRTDERSKSAFYRRGESEVPLSKPAEKSLIIKEEGAFYRVTSHFGGLTVTHTFKGSSRVTVHEASLKAYPSISFQEVFSVPLEEMKNNFAKYLNGFDGNLELNLLMLAKNEIVPLFTNKVARQLPAPDNRIVTDIRITESDDARHIYFCFNSGQWTVLDDELLVKVMHSEPIASYTEINGKRD